MKLNRSAVSVLAIVALFPLTLIAQHPPVPCAVSSWTPEIFTFYGDPATVLAKFRSIDRNLLKHRTYVFIVESKTTARLSYFEVENDRTMRLASLSAASFDGLSNKLTAELFNNDGRKCAGGIARSVIDQYANAPLRFASVTRVASMSEAFEEVGGTSGVGDYIRATFILLC